MKKRDLKFLEERLSELSDNHIITKEQLEQANNFFNKQEKKSVSIIFSSIGLLLIGLSVITLFAVNWNNISREFKCIISFIPLIITIVMLYYSMKNEKLKLPTSIIAPISILATNSLIGQIFHLPINIYNLIFISLLMYMPIAFNIKNYLSIIVYGIGVIFYTAEESWLNISIITLPLFIFNIYNYIKHKDDNKNILAWTINSLIVLKILFTNEILRPEIYMIFLYIISLITKMLFSKDNKLSKFISFIFFFQLFIICINENAVEGLRTVEFGLDIEFGILIILGLFALSREYKNINEYFILLYLILIYLPVASEGVTFILFNLLLLGFGIYKVIYGYKINSPKTIKKGVATILYLIFLRFISSEINFIIKSIMFLLSGLIFIVGSNIFKHKIEENNKNDKE